MASGCGVVACESPVQPPTLSYTVGGAVSGLVGSGLMLVNNSGDDSRRVHRWAGHLREPLAKGAEYRVTVLTQPTSPTQTCVVAGGSGTVSTANVTTVAVACFMAGAASPVLVSSPLSGPSPTASRR